MLRSWTISANPDNSDICGTKWYYTFFVTLAKSLKLQTVTSDRKRLWQRLRTNWVFYSSDNIVHLCKRVQTYEIVSFMWESRYFGCPPYGNHYVKLCWLSSICRPLYICWLHYMSIILHIVTTLFTQTTLHIFPALISSGENSAHFLQLMSFTIFHFFVPLGTHHCWVGRDHMELKACLTFLHMTSTFWSWVQRSIHFATYSHHTRMVENIYLEVFTSVRLLPHKYLSYTDMVLPNAPPAIHLCSHTNCTTQVQKAQDCW